MNHHLLFGLLCLVLGSSPLVAAGEAAFEQANRQFQAGEFAAAAAGYEQLLAAGGPRAAVFYNLGNSYQRLGQYGPAILAYERARLLTPRDPDLLANLALARKATAAFEDGGPYPRLQAALKYLSRNEWSWVVAGATLVLGGLAVGCGAWGLPRRGPRHAAVVVASMAVLGILMGAAALYLRRDEAAEGIVLTDSAAVRLSPFKEAEPLGTPGAGRTVLLRARSGGFHYVEVPGTQLHGWLADTDVAAITAETAERNKIGTAETTG